MGCSNRLAELLLRHSTPYTFKVDILIGFDIAYTLFNTKRFLEKSWDILKAMKEKMHLPSHPQRQFSSVHRNREL